MPVFDVAAANAVIAFGAEAAQKQIAVRVEALTSAREMIDRFAARRDLWRH